MSQLVDAINTIITATGSLPVSNPNTPHPGVIKAKNLLARLTKVVQSRGWWFNTEYNMPFLPNTDGTVTLPPNTLMCDPSKADTSVAWREGKLYNLETRSFQFPIGAEICVDVVLELSLEALPYTAYNYIVHYAKHEFLVNQHTEKTKTDNAKEEKTAMYNTLYAAELFNLDTNIYSTPAVRRMLGPIRRLWR